MFIVSDSYAINLKKICFTRNLSNQKEIRYLIQFECEEFIEIREPIENVTQEIKELINKIESYIEKNLYQE